jgi:hypothetical protein
LNQPVTWSRATTVVVVVGDIAVDDFAADARKPGPATRRAEKPICAPQPVIAEESPAARNGGSASGYQAIFVPSTSSLPATTVNQPYIYTSPRLR